MSLSALLVLLRPSIDPNRPPVVERSLYAITRRARTRRTRRAISKHIRISTVETSSTSALFLTVVSLPRTRLPSIGIAGLRNTLLIPVSGMFRGMSASRAQKQRSRPTVLVPRKLGGQSREKKALHQSVRRPPLFPRARKPARNIPLLSKSLIPKPTLRILPTVFAHPQPRQRCTPKNRLTSTRGLSPTLTYNCKSISSLQSNSRHCRLADSELRAASTVGCLSLNIPTRRTRSLLSIRGMPGCIGDGPTCGDVPSGFVGFLPPISWSVGLFLFLTYVSLPRSAVLCRCTGASLDFLWTL